MSLTSNLAQLLNLETSLLSKVKVCLVLWVENAFEHHKTKKTQMGITWSWEGLGKTRQL